MGGYGFGPGKKGQGQGMLLLLFPSAKCPCREAVQAWELQVTASSPEQRFLSAEELGLAASLLRPGRPPLLPTFRKKMTLKVGVGVGV